MDRKAQPEVISSAQSQYSKCMNSKLSDSRNFSLIILFSRVGSQRPLSKAGGRIAQKATFGKRTIDKQQYDIK